MALATTSPFINGMIRSTSKRGIDKPAVIVVMEDTSPSTYTYHKQCLCVLIDITQKHKAMTDDVYDSKITKIAEMITSDGESNSILQTFCGVSFLDRCQSKAIIASALNEVDEKISNASWKMGLKVQDKCDDLLIRMSMIENLTSSDSELICLLCQLCKTGNQNSGLLDLLLEIGRSIWPYLKRPLWHKEPFVDFVADIFETIGDKLEKLYPKNFCKAWKIILQNHVSSNGDMSCYSRLRLLNIIELKHRKWSLSGELLEFYEEQYDEFTAARKKEILSFCGFLSSRRKTSLTVKPGRSAADFLKRRKSSEDQKERACSSTSSGGGSESCGDLLQDVFEQDKSAKVEGENESVNGRKENGSIMLKNTEDYCGGNLWQQSGNSWQENIPGKETENKENVLGGSGKSLHGNEAGKEMRDKENVCEESGNSRQENDAGKETIEIVWKESGSKTIEDIWQENDTKCEDTYCTDARASSPRSDGNLTNETNNNVFEYRSLLPDRKKEMVKVPGKYVGRVIGTQGSVISSIQDESGATVNIVRPLKDKASARPAFSLSTVKAVVRNTLGLPHDKTSTTDVTSREDIKDEQEEEYEFEIIGTNECIEKAKSKIDSIISNARTYGNHAKLKRSFSDGDEANFRSFRRSSYPERKMVILKVASKYVGRVIGSGGSMIMTIEEESGAKVTFVKDSRRDRFRSTEHMANMERESEADNGTAEHEDETAGERKNIKVEAPLEETLNGTRDEGSIEESKENGKVEENSMMVGNTKVEEKTAEHEFKIFGTDEAIEKARKKIEYIMEVADNASTEKRTFTRRLSSSSSRRGGFGSFQRSLSCPISNWGDRCTGDCVSCHKGCYCRSFLLEQSQSPSCWVRPLVLALSQHADWAEFIVKTQVDDPTIWRPRTSSSASINSGSSDDSNDCPGDAAVDEIASVTPDKTIRSSVNDFRRGSVSSDPGSNPQVDESGCE